MQKHQQMECNFAIFSTTTYCICVPLPSQLSKPTPINICKGQKRSTVRICHDDFQCCSLLVKLVHEHSFLCNHSLQCSPDCPDTDQNKTFNYRQRPKTFLCSNQNLWLWIAQAVGWEIFDHEFLDVGWSVCHSRDQSSIYIELECLTLRCQRSVIWIPWRGK